jgi:uncharacterized protein
LLILVAVNNRKMRIEVGYGLEGAIPDVVAKRIIREIMKPAFKRKDYYTGINEATDELIALASGDYKNTGKKYNKGRKKDEPSFVAMVVLFVFIVIILWIAKKNPFIAWILLQLLASGNRGSGGRRGGGGGWSDFSGGGGSFGGFGGGSFGGGGASGDW